ncbi:Baculoviral IAP repeat-containing protein 7 [Lamellibrachia satsuma]|nr:Baculoviral IAP repeat-containing protein 7 [Lamellibrachia satsuma]
MATGGATGILSLSLQQLQDMKLESKRLESFTNWPTDAYVRPENLAKAGLYYLGIADRVKCAFCNGILRNWVAGDDPMEVHLKYFPKCAFLKDTRAAGNVSIEEEKVNIQQASQNAVANPSPSSQLGVVPPEEPRSLNYSGETSRLSSFRRWPQNSNQSKEDLAQAGFYYTGIEDSVKCFSCNGTLRNWERGDDPWTEHARWFPRCNYVRTVKGEAFIRTVQSAYSGQTNAVTAANSAGNVTQSANTEARRFPVEARVIRARMDTSRVRSVLDMGFSRDLVYKVIEHRLTTTGDDFPNVQRLLEAVFAAEEAAPSSSSSQTTTTMSRAPAEPAAPAPAAAPAENQTGAAAGTSGKGKTQKRKKKNRSTGSSGTKTSVSASESSLSVEMKSELKPATSEEQRLQCKICMDGEAKIVFLPCGHLCSCAMCAPALRNCPICRALIRGTVRVYLS